MLLFDGADSQALVIGTLLDDAKCELFFSKQQLYMNIFFSIKGKWY